MAKYILKLQGLELHASAHSLTNQEVTDIKAYQEENGYKSLSEMDLEIENVINDYEPFVTNMWTVDVPMDSDGLNFILQDETGKEVSTFKIHELTDHYEVDEDYESKSCNGYPEEDGEENILLYIEEYKGIVYGMSFESNETPTPKDFSYIPGCISTPDGDLDFIDKVFFKGTELEIDFDFQDTKGKNLTVQIWTLEDVD